MKVGYLGPKGTFTEAAAHLLSKDGEFIPYDSFSDALKAVDRGEIDEAIVPIENSIEGIVNGTVDSLIFDVNLYIKELLIMPINQCLIAKNNIKLEEIKEVLSHSHALPQCKSYLNNNLSGVKLTSTSSTAEAIKKVALSDDKIAGIGSKYAAKLYNLNIIEEDIQDTNTNFTQFIKVTKEPTLVYNLDMVSLCFSTADTPGSLYKLLDIFSIFDINLSKISSRPMKNRPMEYVFLVDLDVNNNANDIKDALNLIERKTTFCKNLGCYNIIDNRLQK